MKREETRRRILINRDQLTAQERNDRSRSILDGLFRLEEMQDKPTVLFYASFKSEAQTGSGIEKGLASGMKVALPLSLPDEKILKPYLISDPSKDLQSGFCSIPEPIPSATKALDPGRLDVVVVPGSVFDLYGGRLGYGGGFYDRFLADQAPLAFRVALAYELQVVDERLPLEAHDQGMDCLVTESRVLRFERNRN